MDGFSAMANGRARHQAVNLPMPLCCNYIDGASGATMELLNQHMEYIELEHW